MERQNCLYQTIVNGNHFSIFFHIKHIELHVYSMHE